MADVSLMVDRAQEKTAQMQARAAAIDQLVDTGVLEPLGAGNQDDLDRQLAAPAATAAVEAQLQALKAETATLPAGTEVVRILGNDQYRIRAADRPALDEYDRRLTEAMHAKDPSAFRDVLRQAIGFVRTRGERLATAEVVTSDHVLPAEGTTLEEAVAVLAPPAAATPAMGAAA
jgi:phage shock protein A